VEIRTTLRSLARAPLLAIAAVLTIAVAIGGTIAVFALLDSVVLRSLPYRDADRLVAVWNDMSSLTADFVGLQDPRREYTGLDNHRDVRAASRTIADMAAFTEWRPSFGTDEGMQRIAATSVTWNGLAVLGVTPLHGRVFIEAEGDPASPCVVAIGEQFWRRHHAADPGIIGRQMVLTGDSCTIVAVLPDTFRFPFVPGAEIFSPVRSPGNDRSSFYLRQFGRLADGVTLEQAQAEADTIAAALAAQYPAENRGFSLFIEPLQEALSSGVREQLLLLQLAALFVLTIATANLASLMVSRSVGRAAEFGVRAALGAGRWRQFRMLWTEALLLAAGGAASGMLIAAWGAQALLRAFPPDFAQTWDVGLSGTALLFALAATLLTATIMAIVSCFALSGAIAPPGAATGTRITGSRIGRRTSTALIASNFAVALAVAVTGMLLLQSYRELSRVEPGFDPDGVLTGLISLPSQQYSENYVDDAALTAAYDRLTARVAEVPGVQSAGLASAIPLGISSNDVFVTIEGRPTSREDGRAHVWLTRVDDGYLGTMGIRVRDGRGFTATDRIDGRQVAIVNSAFARMYLAPGEATGVRVGTDDDEEMRWWDIVGVVEDVRFFNLAQPQTPALYLPAWGAPARGMYVTLKTQRDPASLVPDLRRAIHDFDPELALTDVMAMGERVRTELMVPRTVSRLTLLFALCALLLAAIGVYGTLAQSVVRRTREFGVRRALGAQDRQVFALVLRQGTRPVLAGLVLGIPLAIVLGRGLGGILYAVTPADPRAWAFAFAALFAVAVVAAFLPGRRAVRVPPMHALRDE
jgi:putative ABC transport system permease protein